MTTRLTVVTGFLVLSVANAAAAVQASFTTSDGTRIVYQVQGQGAPLILIHGWSVHMAMWDDQVPAFSRHFMTIRYDRRGFGQSQGAEDVSRDPQDLWELLQHLGLEEAHLLGMSQGGWVAMSFALSHPSAVTSLILHGTPPPAGFPVQWTGPTRPLAAAPTRELIEKEGLAGFRRVWASHPLLEIPADRPEARAKLMTLLEAYTGGYFLNPATPSGSSETPTWDRVGSIVAPTLLIVGDGESPYLQQVADSLAAKLPHAVRATVSGGGHLINMIEPELYNRRVLEFVASLQQH